MITTDQRPSTDPEYLPSPATVAAVAANAISTGPAGPRIGAFFDLDGTLVRGYTAGSIYRDRVRKGEAGAFEIARMFLAALDGFVLNDDPQSFGRVAFELLKGRTVEEMELAGERLFTERIAGTIRPEARVLVRAHLRMGHTVVIASSATRMQIAPVARDLGIEHIVCSELEVQDGVLTGRSTTGMLWGDPKAAAVGAFAEAHEIDLGNSYGYANGPEDIAFLNTAGRPYAVNPHPALRRAAREYGWPMLVLREPPSPGLRAYLGTAGALVAVNTGLAHGGGVRGAHLAQISGGFDAYVVGLAAQQAREIGQTSREAGVAQQLCDLRGVARERAARFADEAGATQRPAGLGTVEEDLAGRVPVNNVHRRLAGERDAYRNSLAPGPGPGQRRRAADRPGRSRPRCDVWPWRSRWPGRPWWPGRFGGRARVRRAVHRPPATGPRALLAG